MLLPTSLRTIRPYQDCRGHHTTASAPERKGSQMLTTMAGILALENLRTQMQEDAGDAFPQDLLPQLLVLYDVCRCLELNIFLTREVMGDIGWIFVRSQLDAPVGRPTAKAFKEIRLAQ